MLCTPPQLLSASEMKLAPYFRRSLRAGSCPFHQSGAGRHECSCGRGASVTPTQRAARRSSAEAGRPGAPEPRLEVARGRRGTAWSSSGKSIPRTPTKVPTQPRSRESRSPHTLPPRYAVPFALILSSPLSQRFPPESENAAGELGSGEPGKKNISYHKLKLLVQENLARDWTGFDQGPGGVWVVKTRLLLRQSE